MFCGRFNFCAVVVVDLNCCHLRTAYADRVLLLQRGERTICRPTASTHSKKGDEMNNWRGKLCNAINKEFGEPWHKPGFVKSWINDSGVLYIKIGSRDISVNDKGELTGAGTSLCELDE